MHSKDFDAAFAASIKARLKTVSAQTPILGARLGDRGKQRMINPGTGRYLPCCYKDCWEDGDNRYKALRPHDNPTHAGEMLIYIFCGPVHREFWSNDIRAIIAQQNRNG